MFLKRFFEDSLAQASYLVGCQATGEAIVIDPGRDLSSYIAAAANERLRITAVTETHIHADFLSGARELAHLTGAQLYLSGEGGEDWQYAYADDAHAVIVCDGDQIRIGNLRFDVVKTPGHTPEHISFLLTDEAASPEPQALFTGDFVFVGDVGRPDLLESAAGFKQTAEPAAHELFRSIQKLVSLPEHLLVWPGHGAGSACGKSLGALPVSTLGYERKSNWGLDAASEQRFVAEVLDGQPDPPTYFSMMKRLNREGPAYLYGIKTPARRTDLSYLDRMISGAGVVLDVRPSSAYLHSHIPHVLHIPFARSFVTWAGWLLTYDKPVTLIAPDEHIAHEATRQLSLIGLDKVEGWYGPDVLDAYEPLGKTLVSTPQVQPEDLPSSGDAVVLDVRTHAEWHEGHLPQAVHIPLGRLRESASSLPAGRRVLVHCQSGARSPIAASVLETLGFEVADVEGGYGAMSAPPLTPA